jgi:hypothetical protein
MAYVRQRTTKAGAVWTALVKSYRDASGRPRQRLLANLHGQPNTLQALAMLAAQRDALRKEREHLAAEAVRANQFYEAITRNTLQGHQYAPAERVEIDAMMAQRERLLIRFAKVDRVLATLERERAVIKKHCAATPDKIQAAIQAYKAKLREAESLVLGMQLASLMRGELKEARAALRRLSPWSERTSDREVLGLAEAAGLRSDEA